ncbi:hypothetical protein Ancab_008304 [Ancistrocladus abbreviatus]
MKAISYFLLFSLLLSSYVTRGEDRAPHGLAYESPVAFSPKAYDFFHPNAHRVPCDDCSPYYLATQVRASEAQKPQVSKKNHMGVGGVFKVMIGIVSVLLLAMGIYYVMITRKTKLNRANNSSVVEPCV